MRSIGQALTLAAALGLAAPAPAPAQTNVLSIFDASGSMKATAGTETRIAVARRALVETLKAMPAGTRLGLMMFGHRAAKDCADIELVSPIGADDAATLGGLVQNVEPKGETPIAAALERAAKSFRAFAGQQNTIVLLTDGIEECRGDPCAAARALKAAGLALKVHIVGFMLDAAQRRAIECITTETGGTYFDAADPAGLPAALTEVRKAVARSSPAPSPAPATPAPAVRTAPAQPRFLKVTALEKAGGQPFGDTLTLTLLSPDADADGKRDQVAQAYNVRSPHVFRNVAPGRYLLAVRPPTPAGITRQVTIEVPPDRNLEVEVALDVACVRLDARLGKSAYDAGITWVLADPRMDLAGRRRTVAEMYDARSGQPILPVRRPPRLARRDRPSSARAG